MARVITCDLCHEEEATAIWSSTTDGSTIAFGDNCAPVFVVGIAQSLGIWPEEPVQVTPDELPPAEPKPKRARKMTAREREIYLEDQAGDEVDGTVHSSGDGDAHDGAGEDEHG